MEIEPVVPVGYLYKRVVAAAPAVKAPQVVDVYSVSDCVNDDFAKYIDFWRHNGYWLFDSPGVMHALAAKHAISLEGLTLFYYEAYESELDREGHWVPIAAEASIPTDVTPPTTSTLEGFDVVTFSAGNAPECSPLSCNGLADDLPVNAHCLFSTFDEAFEALEHGRFKNSEPGPYRIFAVYRIPYDVR